MNHSVRRNRRWAVGAALLALVFAGSAACSGSDDRGSGADDDAATESAAPIRYVALGDSFTSAPFVPDVVNADGCFRSTNNYPALVGRTLPSTEVVDVSCSAADTTHMSTSQVTTSGTEVAPQFDALTPETDLVTLGIGGNDFEVYGTMISVCPTLRDRAPRGAPCRDEMQADGKDALLSDIERTGRRVTEVVGQIRERSPQARILLVNYPRLTPPEGPSQRRCDALPLARGDYEYADTIGTRMDQMLRDVAEETDAELVDLWTASEGHDICSDDPWVNGSETDFSRALEYHPFAEGQQAAADLVLEALGLS